MEYLINMPYWVNNREAAMFAYEKQETWRRLIEIVENT